MQHKILEEGTFQTKKLSLHILISLQKPNAVSIGFNMPAINMNIDSMFKKLCGFFSIANNCERSKAYGELFDFGFL